MDFSDENGREMIMGRNQKTSANNSFFVFFFLRQVDFK